MAKFHSLEEAQAYFQGDRFASGNGITLEALSEERSAAGMVLRDDHRNALGGVMGGAIFTLADFASAALTNHLHSPTVAQQVSINYLAAPKGGRLVATARYKKDGRSSCVVNVDIVDDSGREIAQFVGTGFKVKG